MDLVTRLGAERSVEIFSKKHLLHVSHSKDTDKHLQANHMLYELDEHPNAHQMEKELKAVGLKPNVPAVFIGQELIGRPDEIMRLKH